MRYLKKKSSKSKSKPKRTPTVILYDDREKKDVWEINHPDFTFKRKRLAVGDYTIEGYEKTVAIEKKSGLVELITNLSGKDRPRFKRFLVKLSKYPIRCIIIEDSLSYVDAAFRACPKSHLSPASIYYWLSVINIEYEIPTIFIGHSKQHREEFLYYLFTEILKKLERERFAKS